MEINEAIRKVNEGKEVSNMTLQYYEYLIDTFQDVITDLTKNLGFCEGSERIYDKGKIDAYVDIMHMIYDDYMNDFEG